MVPLTLALAPLYVGSLPGGALHLGRFTATGETGALLLTVLAVVYLLLIAPTLVCGAAALDGGAAGLLLGPGPDEQVALARRVEELVISRTRVLDSVEAERRRIERDLHDGAQQRLVALALTLGRAQARLATDPKASPEPAGAGQGRTDRLTVEQLLAQAHQEADAAIAELRHLTRGLAPPVLAERGLDAALSGLAARAPLPVSIHVDPNLPRLPATVEAVVYFVASEALTNIAKHAAATRAELHLTHHNQQVRLMVRDNGRGGANPNPAPVRGDADPARGTGGLTGLADRLSGVDGTLRVHSPAGGGTTLTAEVPCTS